MVLALQNLGGVYDVGCCCCFSSLEVFHFIGFRHHLSPSPFLWAITEFLHLFYTFNPAHRRVIRDTFILSILRFSLLPRVLRFWADFFLLQPFFTLHSFACDSDANRNTPSRIYLCACPHRVVPSGWRMALNYWCLNYKTIGFSIAPVSHEVES